MMTAAEFAARRHELPDGGRWMELVAGETHGLHPPDDKHGDVVLNLSKAIAGALRPTDAAYVNFEVGVLTARNPDTVRFPAMSIFTSGDRFAGIDAVYVTEIPALVVEIVSTNDRRRSIAERVYEYHHAGVSTVWVADPQGGAVTVLRRNAPSVTFRGEERLSDFSLLPRFEVETKNLFVVPGWWQEKKRSE
jgi:Uma2 family endonuclease